MKKICFAVDAEGNLKMDDLIRRAAAIDILYNFAGCIDDTPGDWYKAFKKYKYELENLPSAQPEPLSDAYMNAVWTWLIDYQIKAAELKGRYTPYEVLSWVVNDWRKEHERSDKQTSGY